MSTRVRNPEIYVKGYGKNTTKDDLKSWFKEFGKIICIQYKGPYSFIVHHHSFRNSKITMMLRLPWRRWTTKRSKDFDWLLSLQERSGLVEAIVPEAAAVTTRRSTAGDAGTYFGIQFFIIELVFLLIKELRFFFFRLGIIFLGEPQGERQIKA